MKVLMFILNCGCVASLLVWAYGNAVEKGELYNAGYRNLGVLGMIACIAGIVILHILTACRKHKNSQIFHISCYKDFT